MSRRSLFLSTVAAGALLSAPLQVAYAADVAPAKPAPGWWDTFTVSAAIEAGLIVNPGSPSNGLNFGSLFTDRSNLMQLNQVLVTAARPIDPTSKDYDFGFKLQGLYGSDARYTHFLGELDYAIDSRYQIDVVEANLQAHLPWFAGYLSGGIDAKVGQFVSLEGAEVIEASANLLYSHSYIFNFGVPLKLTGAAFVAHVIPEIDLYAGVNTGNNTTFGWPGDNNAGAGFEGGIGLNLLGGNLTALATTNIGPQNAATPLGVATCNCAPSSTLRFYNDLVITWKATDKLTFIGEANWVHDDAIVAGHAGADGYGVAGYGAYALTDWLKIVGRAEVWRDNQNYFVSALGTSGNFNIFKPAALKDRLDAISEKKPASNSITLDSGGQITDKASLFRKLQDLEMFPINPAWWSLFVYKVPTRKGGEALVPYSILPNIGKPTKVFFKISEALGDEGGMACWSSAFGLHPRACEIVKMLSGTDSVYRQPQAQDVLRHLTYLGRWTEENLPRPDELETIRQSLNDIREASRSTEGEDAPKLGRALEAMIGYCRERLEAESRDWRRLYQYLLDTAVASAKLYDPTKLTTLELRMRGASVVNSSVREMATSLKLYLDSVNNVFEHMELRTAYRRILDGLGDQRLKDSYETAFTKLPPTTEVKVFHSPWEFSFSGLVSTIIVER